jgi:hypothetical protein
MINAWGQGVSGNEFYMFAQPSKFDNGYEKVYERVEQVPVVDESNRPLGRTIDMKYSGEVRDEDVVFVYETGSTFVPVTEVSTEQKTDNWQEEDNTCTNPIG